MCCLSRPESFSTGWILEGGNRSALSITHTEHMRVCVSFQLKMLTMENQEVASDQLTIEGYEGYGAQDYTLAACQPAFNSALRDGSATASTSGSNGEAPWWTGDEPLYYIVSPKVLFHSLVRLLEGRCFGKRCLQGPPPPPPRGGRNTPASPL